MCALVVWIHHSQIKISEPRHRLQQCWQGSAVHTHTHARACAHTHRDPEEEKEPRSPEEEQTHSPSTAEPTGEHHTLEDGK